METDKDYVGMEKCFFCNEVKGLLLDRRLRKRFPREAVYNKEPCDKCKDYMSIGIIIISVRDGETGDNPYRTGGWWVVKEEAVKRMIRNKKLLKDLLKKRVLFIEDGIANKIGLKKKKDERK